MELSKEKITSLREKIERKNSVFKDKRYLDSLFLPSKIIGREKQAEQLIQYIDSLRQGLLVPVISVYGRSGAGKSTVIRFVCQNMSDVLSFSFVNLRKAKTVFGCSNLILSELGSENLKSAQGLNKAIDCMENNIEKILVAEKKKFFVLILDEYDVIFSDPRGRPSDFVYKLLTLEENLREKGIWLCIITISNNALSEHDLDDRVKSRIGNSEIFFEPYRQEDVFNILQERMKKAFAIKVDASILKHCAKLSSDDHGDARRALDLLRIAGQKLNAIDEAHKQKRWAFLKNGAKDTAFYTAYKKYRLLDKKEKERKVYFEYKRPHADSLNNDADILKALRVERRGLYAQMLADPRVKEAIVKVLSLPSSGLDVIRRALESGDAYEQLKKYSKVINFLTTMQLFDKRYDYYTIGFRNVPHHYWLSKSALKLLSDAK